MLSRAQSAGRVAIAAAALAGALLTIAPARAADYTWTVNTTNGAPLSDGGGGYTAGGLNWVNGSLTRVAWPNTTSDTMVFGVGSGTAGQVVTGSPVTANGLKFAQPGSGAYSILIGSDANSITLGGITPTITVNPGVSATMSPNNSATAGRLAGNDITITGGGTLILSGMSTSSVSTSGLMALGRGTAANNTNTSIIQDGSTTVNFNGSGGFTLANNGNTDNQGGSGKTTYTLKSGTLAGNDGTAGNNYLQIGRNWAAEFKQEGGTVTLNATSASTLIIGGRGNGTFTMSGGLFSATAGGFQMSQANPTAGSKPVSALLISGGTMRFGLSGSLAFASGSSSVTISGGELAINTLTKGAGTVTAFDFSGGTLRPYNANATVGSTTAGNNFTITLKGTGATFSGIDNAASTARTTTVEALLSGTGRVNVGGGRVVFGNASNSYTGSTVIAGGTLALDADAVFSTSPTIVVGSAASSGAAIDLTAKASAFAFGSSQTVGGIGSVLMPTGGVTVAGFLSPGDGAAGTLAFANAQTLDIQSAITGGSGRFLFDLGPAGDLVTVASGTLSIGSGNLAFDDFTFNLSPLTTGTFRLFSANAIAGTITSDTAARTGSLGSGYTGTLEQGSGFIDLVVVPEPGAFALAGLGAAAAAALYRRRSRC